MIFNFDCHFLISHQIATHTLWNIRIVVLAKPEHENRISHIFCHNVRTGIANALGQLITTLINKTSKCDHNSEGLNEHDRIISFIFICVFMFAVSGNKGAVGVSFMFNDTSFGFVNSHLTSGSEKKLR